jgi:CheY-like chemotaxis protein
MRVLLVEDDPANQKALERLLKAAGFEVAVAANGIEAFDLLEQQKFDALVTDLRMPRLGGISLFQQIEEAYPGAAGRTVFITAVADEPPIREFLEHTGQPFLPKPFDPAQLLEMVRRVARRASGGTQAK